MSNVYNTLISRVPSNLPTGKSVGVVRGADAAMALRERIAIESTNPDRTARGRGVMLAEYVKKSAGPAFRTLERQHAWHGKRLETMRATLDKKVRGEHDALDGERRAVLRSLNSPSKRAELIFRDPQIRSAALRGGETLSGVDADVLNGAFEQAAAEIAPADVQAIKVMESGQEWANAILDAFRMDIMKTMCVVEDNNARPFGTELEMHQWLDKNCPPPNRAVLNQEEIAVDKIEIQAA